MTARPQPLEPPYLLGHLLRLTALLLLVLLLLGGLPLADLLAAAVPPPLAGEPPLLGRRQLVHPQDLQSSRKLGEGSRKLARNRKVFIANKMSINVEI